MASHPSPRKPRIALPAGACDTHFHVFGPRSRFPYAEDRSYTPDADASKEQLFALHAHLGIQRGVVVQSAVHQFDNAASADLIAARPRDYVGVALVPTDVDDATLRRLHAQGFRGARFHYMKHLGAAKPIAEVMALGRRFADIGWHLQLHFDASLVDELAPALVTCPVPIVLDHMGRIDASLGLSQQPFAGLLRLLENEKMHVKVSGLERASKQGSPWADAMPFAQKLVAEFGERCFWGTDWPHPNLKEIPDDGLMVDQLAEIAPGEAQRKALLVDNPARFYGFS